MNHDDRDYDLQHEVLPPGSNPRPSGRGWMLVDYSWDENNGVARFAYRRRWDPKERVIVKVQQPASSRQVGWKLRPPIDRPTVLARHNDTVRHQARMLERGVYGR